MSLGHVIGSVLVTIAILGMVVCVIVQRRALNKIAFGRSMFISFSSIILGLFIGLKPSIPTTILSAVFLVIGYGFLILMAVKSYQHMRTARR